MAVNFQIRVAREGELAALAAVEHNAASIFAQIPDLVSECQYPAMPIELLQTCQVYVACCEGPNEDHNTDQSCKDGRILGYLAIRRLDSAPYIAKISVVREAQSKGVGTALLAHAESNLPLKDAGVNMALTTFGDVPWNGKWYKKLGFEEVSDLDILEDFGPAHLALFQQSKEKHEINGWRWVLMAKKVAQ